MHSPSHPGELLKEEILRSLGLTVTAAAAVLGVGRPALSTVLNGKAGLSPEKGVAGGEGVWRFHGVAVEDATPVRYRDNPEDRRPVEGYQVQAGSVKHHKRPMPVIDTSV